MGGERGAGRLDPESLGFLIVRKGVGKEPYLWDGGGGIVKLPPTIGRAIAGASSLKGSPRAALKPRSGADPPRK